MARVIPCRLRKLGQLADQAHLRRLQARFLKQLSPHRGLERFTRFHCAGGHLQTSVGIVDVLKYQ